MTRPRKPRNNARKKAARAVQRETGLRYKKALAQVSAPAPARRAITADGDSPMTASIGLICAQAAVDAAIKALEIPPTTNDLPAWRTSQLFTDSLRRKPGRLRPGGSRSHCGRTAELAAASRGGPVIRCIA